jgi:catechol 2,3-dioxygenase-like lactoylglutathione lyase family enzyme
MKAASIVKAQTVVIRLTVADMQRSVAWYVEKLGLRAGQAWEQFAELEIPEIPYLKIGLKVLPTPGGSGGEVTTFVVTNITATRQQLVDRGVQVDSTKDLPDGVQLAFFKDPDGNRFVLRQDPEEVAT